MRAPAELLRRVLVLEDRRALGSGLLLLLLLLSVAPLPLVGLRSLRLAPAAFAALAPTLYAYRGLAIRWVPPLPLIQARTHDELVRAHLGRVLPQQLLGCAGFALLSGLSSLVVVLPLLPPCAAFEPETGPQAGGRALLATAWSCGVGIAWACRASLSPSFGRLPWDEAAFPPSTRLRAHASRAVLTSARSSGLLLLGLLALTPALLAPAAPKHEAAALSLVSFCRAAPFTAPFTQPARAPHAVAPATAYPTDPAPAAPHLAALVLLRSLSPADAAAALFSALWLQSILGLLTAIVHLSYARRIAFAPPAAARATSPAAPAPPPVSPAGESLLLSGLLCDAAPLTQHLAFLALAGLASHEAPRRRALLNAPPHQPGWADFFAAARRPLQATTDALLAVRRLGHPSPHTPHHPAGILFWPVRRLRAVRVGMRRRAAEAEALRASSLAAWAVLGLTRLAVAARQEERCDDFTAHALQPHHPTLCTTSSPLGPLLPMHFRRSAAMPSTPAPFT